MKFVNKTSFVAAVGLAISMLSTSSFAASVNPGSWSRGDTGSIYAEWDVFSDEDAAFGVLDTSPDVGSSNLDSSTFNAFGSIVTGTSNVYTFNGVGPFTVSLTSDADGTSAGTVEAYVQASVWGQIDTASVFLNGLSADTVSTVVTNDVQTSFGPVDQYDYTFSWVFAATDPNFDIGFSAAASHTSLTGFAFDAQVAPVPLPAAAWLFGSALFGLAGIKRRANKS